MCWSDNYAEKGMVCMQEKFREIKVTGTYELEAETGDGLLITVLGNAARIDCAKVGYKFEFQEDDVIFLNGYQSWTLSREMGISERDNSMRFCPKVLDEKFGFSAYGDGTFYQKSYKKWIHHGYSYAYVRRGEKYFFFGSKAENTGFTRIIFNTKDNEIVFEKDCEGRCVGTQEKQGESYVIFDLYFNTGAEAEVFDGWFNAMGIVPRTRKKLTGYTSWYNYYTDINEEILLRDVEGMSMISPSPDIFQIDDGYESAVGDWLSIDEKKFPRGLSPVVGKIGECGFTAGIWMAPFVCEKNSDIYRNHKDWLVTDEQGKFVYGGSNWSGMYALDFYNEDVRDYIAKCISYYKEMGFTLFKLDFLYAVCMVPRKNKTRGEIMSDAMDFLRSLCGEASILGCGVPLSSAFGKVEFCRIGMDMSLSFDDSLYMRPFHTERPSTKNTMMNTIYRRQLSGRAFMNDPDVFLLRKDNIKLKPEIKSALGKVNCLLGGVLFTSDNFADYDEEQKKYYRKLMKL
jgi:alpha-galactosidase